MSDQTTPEGVLSDAAAKAAELVRNTADTTATTLNIQYIQRDISEMKGTLKDLSGYYATKAEMVDVEKEQQDHEDRLRGIEQNMFKWIGAVGVISILGGVAISYVLKLLK